MPIFKKTIFTGFAPNLTKRDVFVALKFIFFLWNWRRIREGNNPEKAENKLKEYFGTKYSLCFDSGRSALNFALQALGIKEGDEVLVQAFTCVVVANAIKWTGAKPVYIDIGEDFNMDPDDLERKITPKSKVLIIQHTFGKPAQIEKLLEIAKKNNLKIIEDCAHSFGIHYENKLVGTFGDIGMLSFGSDKSLSCVRGGALITNNFEAGEKLKKIQSSLKNPRIIKTIQHLMHFPFFYLGKRYYGSKIGKIILAFGKRFGVINKIIYKKEKQGEKVSFYPSLLANSLAEILLNQLGEIDKMNMRRIEISKFYNENLTSGKRDDNISYLRYPILVKNPEKLLKIAKKKNIILGDWYNSVIAPKDINLETTGYKIGMYPKAEKAARHIVNLPTDRNINPEDAKKIVDLVNEYEYSNKRN